MAAPERHGGSRRALVRVFVLLSLMLLVAGGVLAAYALTPGASFGWPVGLLLALMLGAAGALSVGFMLVGRHFDDLERLRGALLVAAGRTEPLPADWPPLGEADPEVRALGVAAARAISSQRALGGQPDEKLAAVVGAVPEGLLVMTESGLVSLVNAAAQNVFGPDAVAVGTSIYAALERDEMVTIERKVHDAGAAMTVDLPHVDGRTIASIMAPLGEHGGFVLSLPHGEPGRAMAVQHDLTLHDRPPQVLLAPGAIDGWPLEDLPCLVLDSETTGLDVRIARLLSVGAVRSHGWRLYPHANIDCLVNPDVSIPRQSTAVHGISDAMVEAAPRFPEIWPTLKDMMAGVVTVGYSIGFDLTILKSECDRYGVPWCTPLALDAALLFSALYPAETDLNLEQLADRFGVEIEGRHTALGDALVTAEIWLAMIPQLLDRGVRTYGDARRFSAQASVLLQQQRQSGWMPVADIGERQVTDG